MLSDEERADRAATGRAVIAHLRAKVQRARERNAERVAATKDSKRPVRPVRQAALVVLDNLDDARLLGQRQLDRISEADWDWLRLVATTRLEPEAFGRLATEVIPVEVGPLSEDESLLLIREHQPVRQPGKVRRFRDDSQQRAAREVAAELGGLTLVVEQVAVHLGLGHGNPLQYVEPSEYLDHLRAAGPASIDEHVLGEDAELDQLRHPDAVMAYVMETTLAQLPPDAAMALKVAALLPADAVPWPWVAQILVRRGATTPPDKVDQILTGRRLLTRTTDAEFLRIHRVHAAHLARDAKQFESDVVAVIAEAVEGTHPGGQVQVWQLRAVLEAAPPRLGISSDLAGIGWGDFLVTAYAYLGVAVLPLAEAVVSARRVLYDGATHNQTYQRDLAIGLRDWAWLVQDWDSARADEMYRESVALHRVLYDGATDNKTYQRELAVGLGAWAWLVQDWDSARADEMYAQSVALHRVLYDGATDNKTYQRDLAIAIVEWSLRREWSGQAVPISDWVDACRLLEAVAAVRPLPSAGEEYRRLACSRASGESPDAAAGQFGEESGEMLDESILDEVGLGALPEPQRRALLRHLASTLQERVGTRIAAGLTDQQLAEFERFIDAGNQEEALAWLQVNAPDFQDVTRAAMEELKAELRANAAAILAARDGGDPPA